MGGNDCRKRKQRVYVWRLKAQGAWRESLKRVKAARRAGWALERVQKTAPPFHRNRDLCGKNDFPNS
jgi:hypothetical protein